MKRKILDEKFFNRPALEAARDFLGKFLVRRISPLMKGGLRRVNILPSLEKGKQKGVKEIACMITEVEAYDGPKDFASHASRGKTERNAIMFGEAGYFYVYLCYGMYNMLNAVVGKKNYPAAVLIRGAEIENDRRINLDGPGKLTKYFKIGENFNKKKIGEKTGLWLEDRGVKIDRKKIKRTPRIGVAYAGPVWSKKPYRFILTK